MEYNITCFSIYKIYGSFKRLKNWLQVVLANTRDGVPTIGVGGGVEKNSEFELKAWV